MAGWLTKKFSTIFRGPYFLYWKERREGRRIVGLLIRLRRYVLETMSEEVRKEHNIEKALKDQDKIEEEAKQIDEKSFRLGFNVELDEEKALNIIRSIEEAFANARANAIRRKNQAMVNTLNRIEAEFQVELSNVLNEGEREDKEIYWKYLEPVIRLAERSGDYNTLMAKVALLVKKEDVSRLAATAFRWEARGVRKNLVNLKKDKKKIKQLLKEIVGVNAGKVAINLKACVKMIVEHAKNEFRSAYLLWKRDFLLNLVLLRLLDLEEKQMWQFVKEKVMPKAPEMKNIQDIEEIKKNLAKNCHILAQGFRRLIGEESKVIRLSEGEKVEIKRSPYKF